jgi:hypothetical protein
MDDTYFDDAREMFMTAGWKTFNEELEEALATCTLDSCNSTEEFWQMRGRLITLRQLAGYENSLMASEAQQEEDDA